MEKPLPVITAVAWTSEAAKWKVTEPLLYGSTKPLVAAVVVSFPVTTVVKLSVNLSLVVTQSPATNVTVVLGGLYGRTFPSTAARTKVPGMSAGLPGQSGHGA